MATLLSRLLAAVLLAATLCVVAGASPAAARPAARVDAAVAVGAGGKAAGIGAVCARRAKRKMLRSFSGATASARTATRTRMATARLRRRARTLRHRCLARLRRAARSSAGKSVPLPEAGPLAIAIDGGYGDWSDTETEERAALGAAVTRHEWDPAEAVDDQDDVVLSAAEVHTRIHALLGGNELGDPGHYREWVVAFIRRYGPGGSFWSEHPELDASRYAIATIELGNEPYFGEMSAAEYADTVRPALEEVSRLGLPAKIILVSRVYGTDTSWMDTLYQRIPDLNSLFYAFADHPYWYGHSPAQGTAAGPFGRIGVLRRRMNEKGASAKPIFITEYGESTASCGSECVNEAVQAEHLREMLDAAIARTEWKIEMVSLYQLLDRGTGSGERERQFGLLRQDGTEKPSYAVVRDAMQRYRG